MSDPWDELSASELAMLFSWGLLPSQIPAGFANRHARIKAAQMEQLRNERPGSDSKKMLADAADEMEANRARILAEAR